MIHQHRVKEIRKIKLLLVLLKEVLLLIKVRDLIDLIREKFVCRTVLNFLQAFGSQDFKVFIILELVRKNQEDQLFHSLLRVIKSLKVQESMENFFQAFLNLISSIGDEIKMKFLVQYPFKHRL